MDNNCYYDSDQYQIFKNNKKTNNWRLAFHVWWKTPDNPIVLDEWNEETHRWEWRKHTINIKNTKKNKIRTLAIIAKRLTEGEKIEQIVESLNEGRKPL